MNLLIQSMVCKAQVQDPDGILTLVIEKKNPEPESHHSSQHICGFCTTSTVCTPSIQRCGRGEGCLHHRGSKSLSSQKLIDFTVLIWLSVGLTQARQPLLVLYCVFAGLQNWRDANSSQQKMCPCVPYIYKYISINKTEINRLNDRL